ncbi:BRCA1-A complex subunit RAP80 [Suncus etruscus]|uniref:BRCA1-A complex subunit RAP80 n=1 Tax=Suncus etruscus TaxID=109475 RepID=UPI00211062A3|nr:BRCA1-A complex subunit RAP80 [Suncus etruscus]
MPRRKKKVKEASEAHTEDKAEAETSSSGSFKRKHRVEKTFIVISDSEGEEPKEENGLQNTKMKELRRGRGLAVRKIAQMTEEEQFALALQMSEQEAREVNSQEEEEEALLRKAIAESLNSCQPSDAPASSSGPPSSQFHQENTDSGTTEGIWHLGAPSRCKGSLVSQGHEAEDRKAPGDHPETTEEQSTLPVSENEDVDCLPRCTGYRTEHTVCETVQENTRKGTTCLQAAQGRGHTAEPCWQVPTEAKHLQDTEGTVHYFWGIPFCPAGMDPNQYTKVILCQLEVYQKSLKMAQRQLLRKKGFGDPVLPGLPFQLHSEECGQGDQASEQKEGSSEDLGEEDKEARQESRAAAWYTNPMDLDFQESPGVSLPKKLLLEEEQPTSHGQSSQGLFVEETFEEGNSIPASEIIATLPSKRSSIFLPEVSAGEITVCPETQLSSPESLDLEREVSRGSREKIVTTNKEVDSGNDTEKKIHSSAFVFNMQVSCPLCDQGFPPTKIELHAMYCNGLVEQEKVLTRRQREAKNRRLGETSSDTDENEKCYLCKAMVPIQDYYRHIKTCLRHAKRGTNSWGGKSGDWQNPGSEEGDQPIPQGQGNPKGKDQSEGRLLNLLEHSEPQTADAETSVRSSEAGACRVSFSGMEEAGCSREKSSSLTPLSFNESPIKSFVCISEATDCLVDFKKQFTAPPGSRPLTKGGRGRRKKS